MHGTLGVGNDNTDCNSHLEDCKSSWERCEQLLVVDVA